MWGTEVMRRSSSSSSCVIISCLHLFECLESDAEGYTLMRGLPMDFSNDPTTFSIDNQYLFGPSIMVTPVTEHQDTR